MVWCEQAQRCGRTVRPVESLPSAAVGGGDGGGALHFAGDKQERTAHIAWPPGSSSSGAKQGSQSGEPGSCVGLFEAQVVPTAVRKDGEYTQDAQEIAPARAAAGGVCFPLSGEQETQAASVPLFMYVYQR